MGLANEEPMKASTETTNDVLAVLQAYADTYARRDADGMLGLFADDADLVVFGSGADELRIGKQEVLVQARRDWSQSDSISLAYDWSSVSAAGAVAWASTKLTVVVQANGQRLTIPARFSVVLEQRDGRWLIVQGHFSFPSSEQAEGDSFPTES